MVIVAWVRFVGPLEPYAQGFADELLRQGYSPMTGMKDQLFFVSHLSRWLASQGRDVSALGLVCMTGRPSSRTSAMARRRNSSGYGAGISVLLLPGHLPSTR
jgi:integrase/recombinase XerD